MNAQTWRVAALTMMGADDLRAAISGQDAAAWVGAAAACGLAEAQLRLGRMLLESDAPAAFACFLAASDTGNAEAHNMLGRCHEKGWGTSRDLPAAAAQYRIAAGAGLDWAQYNLGHMLLSGDGVARDRDAAFTWYSKAAAQGHVRAMNLVGRCLEQGWGVTADPHTARGWYRRSAMGGYFRGAFNYASMLAAEGCVEGARYWADMALERAPEPTRGHMLAALAQNTRDAMR